jgi:hypothetical protein
MLVGVQPTWVIAIGSIASAVLALSLALGLKEWIDRPRVKLISHWPDEFRDRIVTNRIVGGEPAAFVRLRLRNEGRSTARHVAVRLLEVDRWDPVRALWRRAQPELDGRLLQPSNELPMEHGLETVDVYPSSDRIVDLASVGCGPDDGGARPVFVEIGHPWPPNRANELVPGIWRLELLVCGDNIIKAQRYFVTLSFDGCAPERPESSDIWDHFLINGPSLHAIAGPGHTR